MRELSMSKMQWKLQFQLDATLRTLSAIAALR